MKSVIWLKWTNIRTRSSDKCDEALKKIKEEEHDGKEIEKEKENVEKK